ncbi:MAG: FG-GAP-like repeat-containing protein [Spirochaetaceae bacterium]|jgi:hypothetical protein|nr:FG-GAP-like repeat-containing protein [Spirochaetaceae bacterium]
MKNQRWSLGALLGMAALALLALTACPTDDGGGGGGDPIISHGRTSHLTMLKNLGVKVDNIDLPVAPNGQPYNPIPSSSRAAGAERTLGPLGKTFSIPKREIFVAGYGSESGINGKSHALYEDFENSTWTILGQDTKADAGWAGGELPRKSVAVDLDGDGVDEVVILTVTNTDKILINKGVYKNKSFTVTQVRELTAPESRNAMLPDDSADLEHIGWSLIAADLNGDGRKECVFTLPGNEGAYMYILNNNLAVDKHVDLTQEYWLTKPEGHRYFARVTAADYDQDGKDELCFIYGVNTSNFYASYYILDDKDENFSELTHGNVSNSTANMKLGNVIAADFTGDGLPDTVFYGQSGNDNNNYVLIFLKTTTLDANFRPVFAMVESANWSTGKRNGTIVIPTLSAGDVDGDRKSELYAWDWLWTYNNTLNEFEQKTIFGSGVDVFDNDYYDVFDAVFGDVTGDQKDDLVVFYGWKKVYILYYDSGAYHTIAPEISTSGSWGETGCLPNVDNDSFILRDTGERELLFTDPHVIAVLASPPYYAGVNEDGDGGTSFGYSKGKESSSSNTVGFSVGASIGTKFAAPFGLAEAEFKTTITTSFGWTQSKSKEITESWGWNTPIGQDTVLFTAIPFDVYYYEVLSAPPEEDAKPGDKMTINVPRKTQHCHVPLAQYNAGVKADQRITVNHTLGAPGTYFTPAQRDAQKSAAGDKGLFSTNTQMTAGQGGGSTTINIETVTGTEDSFAFDLGIEVSAEGVGASLLVGASAGFSYGYETTSSVSEGTYIEGEVPAIPVESYNSSLDFDWGLMAYPKKDGNQEYILVTYWIDPIN